MDFVFTKQILGPLIIVTQGHVFHVFLLYSGPAFDASKTFWGLKIAIKKCMRYLKCFEQIEEIWLIPIIINVYYSNKAIKQSMGLCHVKKIVLNIVITLQLEKEVRKNTVSQFSCVC